MLRREALRKRKAFCPISQVYFHLENKEGMKDLKPQRE